MKCSKVCQKSNIILPRERCTSLWAASLVPNEKDGKYQTRWRNSMEQLHRHRCLKSQSSNNYAPLTDQLGILSMVEPWVETWVEMMAALRAVLTAFLRAVLKAVVWAVL